MMTRLYSSTVLGVDGVEVEVEVDFRPMAEKRTFIVGLPDAAVKESGQRCGHGHTKQRPSLSAGYLRR